MAPGKIVGKAQEVRSLSACGRAKSTINLSLQVFTLFNSRADKERCIGWRHDDIYLSSLNSFLVLLSFIPQSSDLCFNHNAKKLLRKEGTVETTEIETYWVKKKKKGTENDSPHFEQMSLLVIQGWHSMAGSNLPLYTPKSFGESAFYIRLLCLFIILLFLFLYFYFYSLVARVCITASSLPPGGNLMATVSFSSLGFIEMKGGIYS